MGTDALRVVVNAFEQCKARECLPLMLFIRKMRDPITRASFSVEVEMQVEERNVIERLG